MKHIQIGFPKPQIAHPLYQDVIQNKIVPSARQTTKIYRFLNQEIKPVSPSR
jgi:hypothetical protein